ncbi:MAG: hypothetical protein H7336_12055 [Bacteriovorax sp.]|nr:hypothetical protein [Bacteriovorax sp.]
MKKIFRALTFTIAALCFMSSAYAYKFVIYTDETVTNKSGEVGELLKTTYPFNKFDVEVEVVHVDASALGCGSTNGIDRLVTCKDSEGIQAKAMKRGGDQVMIIKNTSKYGGSSGVGGGVPVITSSTPARAMLHEYLHTLGLCDEYEYAASEAGFYCSQEASRPNLTFIVPLSAYTDDSFARAKHSGKIPWYGDILSTTPITGASGTRLGTGDVDFKKSSPINTSQQSQVLGEPTGLYQGKICNQAVPKRISWHPGGGSTIMENTQSGLGAPLEKIVERLMASKGARRKMQIDEPKENRETLSNEQKPAGEFVVNPVPQVEVNDTSRSMFKSFFTWLNDIFSQIMNSIPK